MPFTSPADYPRESGIDPRDEKHTVFGSKPPLKIYLKPFTQKLIEKNLWIEVFIMFMLFTSSIAVLLGRELPGGWYFALGSLVTVLLTKFIHIEDETHREKVVPVIPPVVEPKVETPK